MPPYYFGYRQSQRGSICQWDTKGIAKTFGVLTSLPANPIARQTPQFPGLVLFVVFVALICGAAQGRDWVGCPRTDCEFAILSSQLRLPLFLIFAVVLVPVLQLVALPPGLWTILPGRVEVAEAYKAAGVSLPFLPVSLEPLTWQQSNTLTANEAAKALGLVPSTLAKLRLFGKNGPIYCKLGRRVVYRREDLKAWLASRIARDISDADERLPRGLTGQRAD